MIRPLLSAQRFGWALILGAVLGLFYCFLRPVRPRFLADLLFLPALFRAWVYLSFEICRGDIRIGTTLGLAAGFFLWDFTFGRWLGPIFSGFWKGLGKVFCTVFHLFQNFFKKIVFFPKFFLASRKK